MIGYIVWLEYKYENDSFFECMKRTWMQEWIDRIVKDIQAYEAVIFWAFKQHKGKQSIIYHK